MKCAGKMMVVKIKRAAEDVRPYGAISKKIVGDGVLDIPILFLVVVLPFFNEWRRVFNNQVRQNEQSPQHIKRKRDNAENSQLASPIIPLGHQNNRFVFAASLANI